MTKLLPAQTPPHMSLPIYDVAEQWPPELHGKCDFVHQHFAIVGGAQVPKPRQIVENLCQLVSFALDTQVCST